MEFLTDGDMWAEGGRHSRSREQGVVVERSCMPNVLCFLKANKAFEEERVP